MSIMSVIIDSQKIFIIAHKKTIADNVGVKVRIRIRNIA